MNRVGIFVALTSALFLSAGCATTPPEKSASPSAAAPPVQSATPTPTPTQVKPQKLTLALSGDLLWHRDLMASVQADAKAAKSSKGEIYEPLLEHVAPVLTAADVAICNNEVPFAPPGVTPVGYPRFAAAASTTEAYKIMGFDACTTATNHSLDHGYKALSHTLDVLQKQLNITTVGTYRSAEEAAAPSIHTTASGVKIGMLVGTYASNMGYDSARPWLIDTLDAKAMTAKARKAKEAGADIVIAVIHGGDEYKTAPNEQQVAMAEALTKSPDIDIVYGHHAHTVQPVRKINGKWVFFGVGNLVAQMMPSTPRAMEMIIAHTEFVKGADGKWQVGEVGYTPVLITYAKPGSPARIYAINQALASKVGPTEQLKASKEYIRKAVAPPDGLVEK